METIKVHVSKIVDFGRVVSIVGVDATSDLEVVIHIDHRPFHQIWTEWRDLEFTQPTTFTAEQLTLNLAINAASFGVCPIAVNDDTPPPPDPISA